MKRYFFLGLNFAIVVFSLWVQDKARVRMARRYGDVETTARQKQENKPFARVDWIGSVLLPLFLLWRGLPALGWLKPLECNFDNLRRPWRDGLLIAFTGPLTHLLLAMVGIVMILLLKTAGWLTLPLLLEILISFCLINACLGVFNLLPIPPLAGATAAELFLHGDALSAFEDIKPYGFILLLAGVFLNLFDFLTLAVSRTVMAVLGF